MLDLLYQSWVVSTIVLSSLPCIWVWVVCTLPMVWVCPSTVSETLFTLVVRLLTVELSAFVSRVLLIEVIDCVWPSTVSETVLSLLLTDSTVEPSALDSTVVESSPMVVLMPEISCSFLLTLCVKAVTVEPSALFERVWLIWVIDCECWSTVSDTSLKVVVSTLSRMSSSASDMRVSRLSVLVLRVPVSVFSVEMSLSNVVILPSAVDSRCKALVTSLSLMSCQL